MSIPISKPNLLNHGRAADLSLVPTSQSAALAAASSLKPVDKQAWESRAGGDEFSQIFQSAANGARRIARSRAALSRAAQLGLVDPKDLNEKARQLWGAGGEKRLDASARQAAYALTEGGTSSLKQILQHRDPLERLMILSKAPDYLSADHTAAHDDLELALQQLQEHHGDEILALKNSSSAFAKLHEAAPDAGSTADAASGLRSIYLEAGRTSGDAVISPQKLAQGLLEKCDENTFEVALEQLGAGVLADLRSSQPSRHALRVGVALTNAGAFTSVRTSLGIAKDLRARLSVNGQTLTKSDPQVACKLLEESGSGCSSSKAMSNALFGEDAAPSAVSNPATLISVRHAVQSMPESWWPAENKEARFKLLEDIDSRVSVLGDSVRNPSVEMASRLRAQLPIAPVSLERKKS